MIKAARWVLLVGLCWAAVTTLPDIARYLRMRGQ
jgi:hypothetical protein